MAAALVSVLAIGWKSPDGVVETNRLVIRDSDGRERIVVHCDALGPHIQVRDSKGLNKIELTLNDLEEPHLELRNPGTGRKLVLLSGESGTHVDAWTSEDRLAASFGVSGDETPGLAVFDERNKCRVFLGHNSTGFGIRSLDTEGRNELLIGINDEGYSGIEAKGPADRCRLQLAGKPDAGLGIQVENRLGRTSMNLKVGEDNSPALLLSDHEGKTYWQAR